MNFERNILNYVANEILNKLDDFKPVEFKNLSIEQTVKKLLQTEFDTGSYYCDKWEDVEIIQIYLNDLYELTDLFMINEIDLLNIESYFLNLMYDLFCIILANDANYFYDKYGIYIVEIREVQTYFKKVGVLNE